MMEENKKREVIAFYPLSNNCSINICEIVDGINIYIKWRLNNLKINTSKIRSELESERDYFIAYGRKIYIDECMIAS